MKDCVVFILCMCVALVHAALEINVEPSRIQPGITKNLVVNCSVNDNKIPQMKVIYSLVLSRQDPTSTDQFEELVILKYNKFNNTINNSSVPEGSVVINGASYISLTWPNPSYNDASRYKCEAHGMSMILNKLTATAYASVETDEPDVRSLVEELLHLRQETYKAREALQVLTEKYTNLNKVMNTSVRRLRTEKERSKHLLFHTSTVHNGHKYYLSKRQIPVEIDIAQATCALYGGYLAEIEDSDELKFVSEFLKTKANLTLIYIGLTDEGHEGIWINMYSQKDAKFLPWGSSEPGGGIAQNCLVLHAADSWNFHDYPCYYPETAHTPPRYLCEAEDKFWK